MVFPNGNPARFDFDFPLPDESVPPLLTTGREINVGFDDSGTVADFAGLIDFDAPRAADLIDLIASQSGSVIRSAVPAPPGTVPSPLDLYFAPVTITEVPESSSVILLAVAGLLGLSRRMRGR